MEITIKTKWAKPELTVLVRSKPEECILSGCKGTWPVAGTGTVHQVCAFHDISPSSCVAGNCMDIASS